MYEKVSFFIQFIYQLGFGTIVDTSMSRLKFENIQVKKNPTSSLLPDDTNADRPTALAS